MIFPQLNSLDVNKSLVGVFGGLNETEITAENEFSDMKNISSDMYPGLTIRKERGSLIKKITKPNGLFWKNGLIYVDGTSLFMMVPLWGPLKIRKRKWLEWALMSVSGLTRQS